ncbi:MAG TPA: nitroreductase [Hyphomicrobiaceae bacterium]|nr:nitroreductase [Hyphomicrobiaceae bacterium]
MTQPALELLLTRRSVKAAMLGEPGPTSAQLEQILTAAVRVPDHKAVVPWRFIVFEGEARAEFGELLAAACLQEEREPPSPMRLATERARLMRAPTVVAAISRVVPTPGAPEWEQILSCGAACFNLCLAANALGYGTCWITEWYSYSPAVRKALGLADNERAAGFIYIGTARERQPERPRPALSAVVTRWRKATE